MSVLTVKNKIQDMTIGDMIPCRYKASSGTVGVFSELGICTAAEIPVSGTAIPDGKFNFIKVDKGLLIADRVVQTSISWNALNTPGYIEGKLPRVKLQYVSMSSYYSDSAGHMASSGGYVVADPKPGGDWYATRWCPRGDDGNPTYTLKLPETMHVSNFRISAADGAHGVILDNIVTISTSLSSNGPYVAALEAPIKSGTTNYTLPDNPEALYVKFRFNDYPDNYGYNSITLTDIAIPLEDYKIRSLSGGNAYLGTDGKASLTDKGLGAWPPNNEWDKYLVKSNLDGKVTPGDDNVWHWSPGCSAWCKDTPITNVVGTNNGSLGTTSFRTHRGKYIYNGTTYGGINAMACSTSSGVVSGIGFRPVLEYPEDTRCTNIWY
jgi:hypothetical protein